MWQGCAIPNPDLLAPVRAAARTCGAILASGIMARLVS